MYAITDNMGILCSKFISSKNKKNAIEIFWYTIIFLLLLFLFFIIPVLFLASELLRFSNLDPEVADFALECMLYCLP